MGATLHSESWMVRALYIVIYGYRGGGRCELRPLYVG